jgi:hypothetical protein
LMADSMRLWASCSLYWSGSAIGGR